MRNLHKRILVISNLYPSVRNPFYGSFVKNFVDQLFLYAPDRKIDLCLLKGKSKTSLGKLCKYIFFYLRIFYFLLVHRYEFIYVHLITHSTIPIRIVSIFKRLNLIFNIHGQDLLVTTPLAEKLLNIAKPLLNKSKYIVVPSIYFKKITIEKLPNLNEKKIIVSASGGVSDIFFIEDERKNNIPVIGYVSRIDKGKGWDVFIKAAKIINDSGIVAKFIIVGGGKEEDMMKELILELGLSNVFFLGPKRYSELPSIYSSFDLFVFPTKLEESLGLVGLEAMATGLPIIASKIGGITDYVHDGSNGFFFECGNEKDLADKIKKFLAFSPHERKEMSKSAVHTANEYRESKVSTKLFDIIFQT